jgi:hypothetical protein
MKGRFSTLLVTISLCGCSGLYIMDEYGESHEHEVRLSYGRVYRAYEKANKILIEAFTANEAVGRVSMVREGVLSGQSEPAIRYRDAAEAYLAEKKDRRCNIISGKELGSLHSEFTVTCTPREKISS